MALFLSTFVNKVDRKGRVSVPATFRAALAAQRFPGIVAFPSFKFPALDCCGIERMEEINRRLERLDQFSEEYENLTPLFHDAQALPFDGEGRILLPPKFIQHTAIAIEGQAAFVGQGGMFQIWEPERFARHQASLRERALRQGPKLPAAPAPEGGR